MSKNNKDSFANIVYNYLTNNCVGINNAISNAELAEKLNCDKRYIRIIINKINSENKFDCLIGNSNEGYWIVTKEDYQIAFGREWKSGITRLKRLKNMGKKLELSGQGRINIDNYKNEFIEVFWK